MGSAPSSPPRACSTRSGTSCARCTATTSGRSSPSSGRRASTRARSSSTGSPRARTESARSPNMRATRSTRRRARRSSSWRRPKACRRSRSTSASSTRHRIQKRPSSSWTGRSPSAASSSTRIRRSSSTDRCARRRADAHGQAAGGLQAALPDGLERLRGEPSRVRKGMEFDHGLVSLSPRFVSVLVGGGAAVLVLYPIAYLVQASLSVGDPQARPPEAYGLDNFMGLGRYAHIFGNTLLVAALATVLAVIVGFTMGWILSRTNVPGRAAFEQLMAMPYYVTPLMGALAWALIASPSSGFINQVWRALGGDGHVVDINTPWGIAWVMALFEGAVAFVMIGAVMKSMDPAMEEASQVLGAGGVRTMLRITSPHVLPGALGAAVFVFADILGSFSAALVLGLPNRFYVVTTTMYQLVSQYPPRFPTAAAMGVSLFTI